MTAPLPIPWSDRVPIVLVSASGADAQSFREFVGRPSRLIVNVPDLRGAAAAIEKLRPALVLCDTDIEGSGSWRDLLNAGISPAGAVLIVISDHADESLWAEVLNLGGFDVLEKPFRAEEVERVVSLALLCSSAAGVAG